MISHPASDAARQVACRTGQDNAHKKQNKITDRSGGATTGNAEQPTQQLGTGSKAARNELRWRHATYKHEAGSCVGVVVHWDAWYSLSDGRDDNRCRLGFHQARHVLDANEMGSRGCNAGCQLAIVLYCVDLFRWATGVASVANAHFSNLASQFSHTLEANIHTGMWHRQQQATGTPHQGQLQIRSTTHLAGGAYGFNRDAHLLEVVEAIKDAEDVNAVLGGRADEGLARS